MTNYKYLGQTIGMENRTRPEISTRIKAGWGVFVKYGEIFLDRSLPILNYFSKPLHRNHTTWFLKIVEQEVVTVPCRKMPAAFQLDCWPGQRPHSHVHTACVPLATRCSAAGSPHWAGLCKGIDDTIVQELCWGLGVCSTIFVHCLFLFQSPKYCYLLRSLMLTVMYIFAVFC